MEGPSSSLRSRDRKRCQVVYLESLLELPLLVTVTRDTSNCLVLLLAQQELTTVETKIESNRPNSRIGEVGVTYPDRFPDRLLFRQASTKLTMGLKLSAAA